MGLHTPLCDLLGIEHPVMQGSPGPWSSPALTAAISEAGGLGSLGTALLAPEQIRDQVERVRTLTERPFAVNHTLRPLSEEAYALTLALTPAVISLALGLRPELVKRAHAAGSRFVSQVHTPQQTERAAEAGADAIIAQGGRQAASAGPSRPWRWCRRWSTPSRPCRCRPRAGSRTAVAWRPRWYSARRA